VYADPNPGERGGLGKVFGLIVLVELLVVGAAGFFGWDWWIAALGILASIIWYEVYSGRILSNQLKLGRMPFVFRVVAQATAWNVAAWLLGCGLTLLFWISNRGTNGGRTGVVARKVKWNSGTRISELEKYFGADACLFQSVVAY
jgi:hypothetical protein